MSTWGAIEAKLDGTRFIRHAVLTFSGTWAPPGWGYPSDVVNMADPDLVYEVPVQAPWSFGPVGGPADAPSYEQSVAIGVEWACDWIQAHPQQTVILGGYSQGGEAASRVLQEYQTGRLAGLAGNLLGGYTLGNPMRQEHHTGPGIADPGGHGIAAVNLTSTPSTWVDVANKGDLYTATPDGQAGRYVTDFYKLAIKAQIGNFAQFVTDEFTAATALFADVGGLLLNPLPSAVPAITAAFDALVFFGSGTAPHVSYHAIEVQPGVTGVQYAVNHLNSIARATPARAAA